jgi:membrane associated rhomboid family serine protease
MIPIGDDPGRRHRFPFVTLLILAANVLVFVYQLSLGERALERLFYSAAVVPVEFTLGRDIPPPPPFGIGWLPLFTSMFMHGGFLHIASNMLYLFVFGDNVEDRLGHIGYILFYVLCGLAAGLAHVFLNPGSQVPSLGASGAIAGVLAGYLVLFPNAAIRTLVFLGPFITVTRISALFLIGFWFVTQLFSGLASLGPQTEQTGGVAFWAHVGGFVAGLVLVWLFRPFGGRPRSAWYG